MESNNIILLDEIKKNAKKNDLKLTEEILCFTTFDGKNEIKSEDDIIKYSSEDNEENLKCDIRLHTEQKKNKNENLSQQTTLDTKDIKKNKNDKQTPDEKKIEVENDRINEIKESKNMQSKEEKADFEGEANNIKENSISIRNNKSINDNNKPIGDKTLAEINKETEKTYNMAQNAKNEEGNEKKGVMEESQRKNIEYKEYSDTMNRMKSGGSEGEIGDSMKIENNKLLSDKFNESSTKTLALSDKEKEEKEKKEKELKEKESHGDNGNSLNKYEDKQGVDKTKNETKENA
jgi:hypothetical protein